VVSLQRVAINLAQYGDELAGLTFVLRTADGAVWFKDHWRNFELPIAPPQISP